MSDDPWTAFWKLAPRWLAEPDVEEGTLMGSRCLRAGGAFLATVHRKSGQLIVKLDAERTQGLITDDVGVPFAPAGKVFSEWIAIPSDDPQLWAEVIAEGLQISRKRS